MSRVLASLKEYGVDKGDVQTTGLSMDPVYDVLALRAAGAARLPGLRARAGAGRRPEQGGAAVTAAVAAGGNDVRVGDLRLLVGDTDAVMKRARDAAVDEARTKAEQYAEASGEELGDVVTISEVQADPLPTPVEQSDGMAALKFDSSAVPIRAGRDKASVTVRIVWHLESGSEFCRRRASR